MEPPKITLTGAQEAGSCESATDSRTEPQPMAAERPQPAPVTASLASILTPKTRHSKPASLAEEGDSLEYKLFDRASFDAMIRREQEYLRRIEERRLNAGEGRLVEGEIKFDDDPEAEEDKAKASPDLVDGCVLPTRYSDFPDHLLAKPVQEIDPHIRKRSFVVVNTRFRRRYIHRFSANKAFFCLPPWNPIRKFFVYMATNQFVDYIIMLTILANCVCLTLPNDVSIAEYVFLSIYTMECIIKMTARGFVLDSYTYLRDGWNCLDLIVLLISYVMLLLQNISLSSNVSVGSLRTFRVFRVLKTITIFPGMKTIISALLSSFRMLMEVIILTMFCMSVFSLVALQVYKGLLRNKCVQSVDWSGFNSSDLPDNASIDRSADEYYKAWISNSSNWLADSEGGYTLCGNVSGSGRCENVQSGYVCLSDIGTNPNWGYTNFDNFGWSLLSIFQLITLDHWEDLYNIIIRIYGTWNILFFIIIVFFGSFYLINLMLAVVTMRYEEQAIEDVKALERENQDKKRRAKQRQKTDYKFDPQKLKRKRRKTQHKTAEEGEAAVATADEAPKDAEKTEPASATTEPATAESLPAVDAVENPPPATPSRAWSVEPAGEPAVTAVIAAPAEKDEAASSASLRQRRQQEQLKRMQTRDTIDSLARSDSQAELGDAGDVLYDKENDGAIVVEEAENSSVPQGPADRNCPCCTSCCHNYSSWLQFQERLYKIALDPFFELFITFCILMNTLFMATEHYPMEPTYEKVLDTTNYIFTGVFTFEAVIKITAMSRQYFQSGWNVFDLIVVIASLIDVGVEGIKGLSIFRTFRLFRVFRLAQSWETMRKLLVIIFSALGAVGNLSFILFIIVFIFAIIGMELFQGSYTAQVFGSDSSIPRWNFEDFGHSMLMVFRILCGEWIEASWECMRAKGQLCVVVFIPSLILGHFMVLNLFLALLLNSFSNEKLEQDKGEDGSKFSVIKQRFSRLLAAMCRPCLKLRGKKGDVIEVAPAAAEEPAAETIVAKSNGEEINVGSRDQLVESRVITVVEAPSAERSASAGAIVEDAEAKPESPAENVELADGYVEVLVTPEPAPQPPAPVEDDEEAREEQAKLQLHDCCCEVCYGPCQPGAKLACFRCSADTGYGKRWTAMRLNMLRVTEHKVFEGFVMLLIMGSSVSLCFEDVYIDEKPTMKMVLKYLNISFTALFAIEMILKQIALGLKRYFSQFWTFLDFFIVTISIADVMSDALVPNGSNLGALRVLRALRAFRPLRTISRWEGMKIVVNCLMKAIPSIGNVLLVCMVFWLIFSITGIQFFKGKFYKCVDSSGNKLTPDIVPDKATCLNNSALGYQWQNSLVHFDNVMMSFVALFQVATFEGWMEVMTDAIDSTDIDLQPKRENSMIYYLYFVIFIVVGSFFILNLFIGVIIDNFNNLKKKKENILEVFLTPSQKSYYNTLRKLGKKKPQKTIRRPKNRFQDFFYDLSMSNKFELTIVLLIFCNMAAMMIEHDKQPNIIGQCLEVVNLMFTTIFTLEAVVKLIGLRWHYFKSPWNIYDFVIVILSLFDTASKLAPGEVLSEVMNNVVITPTLLRIVRVFRIGRVLRLIKAAKGIRKLLFALIISLPALFNIGALLLLIVFIYAIVGMSLFGNVKHAGAIDDVVNFETFDRTMVLLFRLTTSAGWNDVLYSLMVTPPDCNSTHVIRNGVAKEVNNGNCSTPELALIYMTTFVVVNFLIVINLYIAIILENFNQAHEQEEVGVTDDDFDTFYIVWERYDPHATQYIRYDQLSDFVAELDEPLGIPKPNIIALTSFDIAIVEGDLLHCLDVLVALVRNVLGNIEDSNEFRDTMTEMEKKFRETFPTRVRTTAISTTLRRKKEDIAAKTLQRAWRRQKTQRAFRHATENALAIGRNHPLHMGSSISVRPSPRSNS